MKTAKVAVARMMIDPKNCGESRISYTARATNDEETHLESNSEPSITIDRREERFLISINTRFVLTDESMRLSIGTNSSNSTESFLSESSVSKPSGAEVERLIESKEEECLREETYLERCEDG